MSNYLYSKRLTKDLLGSETRKLKYLKTLIDKSKELDCSISEKFPISYFGNENEDLRIRGVKVLIEGFDAIDSEKMDIMAKYKDIKYVEVNDKKQIVLQFQCEDEIVEAHSIYSFFDEFLEVFDAAKYINYCIRNNYTDVIEKNINWLLFLNAENEEKQYRLLIDTDDTWGVRGVTSKIYKNYDNSIVLYLSLLSLHKYSVEKNKFYHINFTSITDSSINIFFEQDEPVDVPNVGKVYMGLAVSNGEIRNCKFKAELRYRIENPVNSASFSAVFNNPVFSIMHNMNVQTIDMQLEKLFNLEELESNMMSFVERLNTSENLSEDSLYYLITDLLEKIKDCSDISKKTKDEFKKIEVENMIQDTFTLISLFGKLNMISTDVDEKIFIERIYHIVISDLLNKRNG